MAAVHIRIPTPLKERVDRAAKAQKRTLAATVELALEQYLEDLEASVELKTKKRAAA